MNNRCYLSAILSILLLFVILEPIWLGLLNKQHWSSQISKIQHTPPSYKISAAIITYIIMLIGIIILAVSHVRQDSLIRDSIFYGGILGLVMYGVFNFTNYTIFSDYSIYTVITDTSWGIFLCIIATLTASYASYHLKIIK